MATVRCRNPVRTGFGHHLRHGAAEGNRPQGRVCVVVPGVQGQARRRKTAAPHHARLLQEARFDLVEGALEWVGWRLENKLRRTKEGEGGHGVTAEIGVDFDGGFSF